MSSWSACSEKAQAAKNQLEEKVEGLVSLLTAAQTSASALGPDSDFRYVLPPKPIQDPLTPRSIDVDARGLSDAAASQIQPTLPQLQYSSSHITNDSLSSPEWTLSADEQLQLFQNSMASYFPFVVIPMSMTVEELRTTRPVLFDNIMMVTSYTKASRQLRLRSEVIKSVIEQIYFQGKKSLDLLQGILVFTAWYHQCLGPSPQMTNMVQLATALVFDLGLHRAQIPFDGNENYNEAMKGLSDKRIRLPRTLEERRAFLGLFCLSRELSSNCGKTEPLQSSPYVEECCIAIEKQQEYLSDRYLVFQVRLQNIADAAVHSFPFHGVDYWSKLGPEPIYMLVKSFERDLEQFENTLEPELAQNTLFQIHLLSISVHITDIALRKSPSTESTQPKSSPQRLIILMDCLQSTKAFFTKWLSLPSSLYHHLPMNVFVLVAHAVIVLGMLNLFQDDGWDLNYVREIAAFSPTMDKLAQKYEEASLEIDNSAASGHSSFWKHGMKMKKLQDWYDVKLMGMSRQGERRNEDLETLAEAAARDVTTGFDFDMLDEGFWNEMIARTAYDEVV
ncbi:hypothetical protein BP6252_10011 [Coleophoma cylindrospora]|uniref:Transcription factor domain-containing protein n=1 Tax=Coleophoma cylindrospora TaxID=1849047 RepID=A0A3D8QX54_9HELO|nr:hypothetical protein BP6252_10011 [Coleophoma cylindrospora]